MTAAEEWEALWTKDPIKNADSLYERGVKSWEYKRLQLYREERLEFFKTKGIQVIINDAQKLVDFGNNVLSRLIELENEADRKRDTNTALSVDG